MVYKELCFVEYMFEGKKFQWATMTIGKKNPLKLTINYTARHSTPENFTLFMHSVVVVANLRYADFDKVYGHIEDQCVDFYTKENGFNTEITAIKEQYLYWA
ncbi:MAG: hypothetical protein PHN69_04475 [Candidatus Pacebacteria bacterium]|nr:hypothetical protein [Fermentimonas sp.]MDD4804409.1 hypothetical protein [Candidatus Paceibacterota bacterium]